MTSNMRIALGVIICLYATLPAYAQDQSAKIEADVKQARDKFNTQRSEAGKLLSKAFDREIRKIESNNRISATRRIAMLDELSEAKSNFEDEGTLPSVVSLQRAALAYANKVDKAKIAYFRAHETAADRYSKIGELTAAKRILADLEDLRDALKSESTLAEGMVFTGTRIQIINGVQSPAFTTSIKIREVKGEKFYGTMTIKGARGDRGYVVDGITRLNSVSFRAFSNDSKFNQLNSGTFLGGVISVHIKGSTTQGQPTLGKMQLKLEK